jgi:hypothetical protein
LNFLEKIIIEERLNKMEVSEKIKGSYEDYK